MGVDVLTLDHLVEQFETACERGLEARLLDPGAAPDFDASAWPAARLRKANRNYSMNFTRALLSESAALFGPAEAAWRLLECPVSGRSHHVERLAVHIEDWQYLTFLPGDEHGALGRAQGQRTTLTAWFQLNRDSTAARHLRYAEIPEHYA